MMQTAIVMFSLSFFSIVFLLVLKSLEERRGRPFAPALHTAVDRGAEACKRFLIRVEDELALLPPVAARVVRMLLAMGAASFGSVAEQIAKESHRLADFVSHKHNFERRETRSEFLRQVSDHKNGNGSARQKIESHVQ